MHYVLILLTAFGLTASLPPRNLTKPAIQPVVVLELFTSQGCSSCPPADKALQEITQQATKSGQAVYGLSFHVDYWNRLGWQDPFSAKQYTDRQRQYDHLLKTQTYTPQLVINGSQNVIGGQRGRIEQAIQTIQKQPASAFIGVNGNLVRDVKQVTVTYTLSTAGPYRVNVALVQKEARTFVQHGENGGRTLVNTNVVRQFKTIDNSGTSGNVTLSLPTNLPADQTAVLVYVQRKDNGQVIGAKQL
ncbi:DUF1223 domain-containing protein [Spirosoma validum]|uniref:DUF1223 domain-containing protein n=1 Tax=Spirosoma validum TaxID=2771355 RepID=A0A927GBC6_9BACT|nr:DUF1223 domain-containing protein [Spirosoma validum]MBD2751464.1 DUF1223 domain-containing protein [Spirosoma validum]